MGVFTHKCYKHFTEGGEIEKCSEQGVFSGEGGGMVHIYKDLSSLVKYISKHRCEIPVLCIQKSMSFCIQGNNVLMKQLGPFL